MVLTEEPSHDGVLSLVKRLNEVYSSIRLCGFRAISRALRVDRRIRWQPQRQLPSLFVDEDIVVVVVATSPEYRTATIVWACSSGVGWEEILNTDGSEYGSKRRQLRE